MSMKVGAHFVCLTLSSQVNKTTILFGFFSAALCTHSTALSGVALGRRCASGGTERRFEGGVGGERRSRRAGESANEQDL